MPHKHAAALAATIAIVLVAPRGVLVVLTLSSLFVCTAAYLVLARVVRVNTSVPPWRPRSLAFTSPSAWSAVLTRKTWEDDPRVPLAYQSAPPGLREALRTLLHLVRHHFIQPWYGRLSPSPAFPNGVDTLIHHVLLNAVRSGAHIDWSSLIVSRVVPLVKGHMQHYRTVEHLAGPSAMPLPLPTKSHPALKDAQIEAHLRAVLERCVGGLLPEQDRSVIVRTLTREVLLSVVMPIMDMLSDPDFWNRQIDERGGQYLHERTQVNRFLSALSTLPEPNTPVKRKHALISAGSSTQEFDAFIRSIARVKAVGEVRRLRADIERELRGARGALETADDKRTRKYVSRLERALRHIDERLVVLGQQARPVTQTSGNASLFTVLSDPSSLAYWLEFMERRGHSRLVQFWLTVEGFKDPLEGDTAAARSSLAEDVGFLHEAYFLQDAGLGVPHLGPIIKAFTDDPDPARAQEVRAALFAAQRTVYDRMEEEDWGAFCRTELYRKAVQDLTRSPRTPLAPIRHVSDPVQRAAPRLIQPTTPLVRSVSDTRHLEELISPGGKLFAEDEDEVRMEAIQAALDDIIDEDRVPMSPQTQSLSSSLVLPRPPSPKLSKSVDDIRGSQSRLFDEDEEPVVQRAAEGDLHLESEIARLETHIQELVKQEHILDGLIRRAELTGNEAELRLLQRSLSSVRLDLRGSIFQKAQYERQEEENRLGPGRTTITIPNAVVTDEDGKSVARYAVRVTQLDEDVSTAWVVYRRYNDFFELDRALRESGQDLRRVAELPGKKLGPSTSASLIESRRSSLERYLQSLIRTDLCDAPELRDFLSRSASFSRARPGLAPHNIVKSLYNTMAMSLDDALVGPSTLDMIQTTLGRQFTEVAEGFGGVVGLGGEMLGLSMGQRPGSPKLEPALPIGGESGSTVFTAPICDLFIEMFDLDESNWIRRQAVVVILQQFLGGTIERKVRDSMRTASSASSVERLLVTLRDTLFPNGQRREPGPVRTEEAKVDTRYRASRRLGLLIPDMAASMVGRGNARRAARRAFGVVQDKRLNQHLLLCVLDEVVDAVFPR